MHREYNHWAVFTVINISLSLTIQQVSDFIQVDFKIGDLAKKTTKLTTITDLVKHNLITII